MRRLMVILVMVLMASMVSAGANISRARSKTVKYVNPGRIEQESDWTMVFKDYSVVDETRKPVGLGLLTWSDDDVDFEPGVYGQLSWLNYKEIWRFNIGVGAALKNDRVYVRPLTSVTMAFSMGQASFEVGAYYAPFWGLDSRSDDPYGLMFGYLF